MTYAARKLRDWRTRMGISQIEASTRVGVSQAAWSDWEKGKAVPLIRQAISIYRLTGISVETWGLN